MHVDLPEDRTRSPYTGWTRAHWEAVADATLAAVRPYASPGHALIELPGPASVSGRRSDGFEGFARTFLTAGFRLAGAARDGLVDGSLAQWYAEGLAAGVDPASPERWPRVTEVPQAKVEAASIVIALHESREVLWDHLPERVREQTVQWLAEVIGQPYPECNWLWFQNVVEAFLRAVGGPWSAEDIDRNIARMESWHLGGGWYTDGLSGATARNFDWYAGWAMNFYPLWFCRISAADDPLWIRYRERLSAYLQDTQHLIAPDGPPLHQGRSLTYRYAALAPLWAVAIFDATPLPPGRTRRLASGMLRHFVEAGAWDERGLHPIGWYGGFTPIRQPYSGAGSPYWSSKGFAGLVLPADHPVWTDVELPAEVEHADVARTLAAPGWLVSATRADGVVRVVNHGTDHAEDGAYGPDDPGYSRLAYTTHAGPEYDIEALVDNHVALLDARGRASHRRPLEPLGVRGRVGISRHRAHWPTEPLRQEFTWPPPPPPLFRLGPWVTTASVLHGPVELRLIRVDDPSDGDPREEPGDGSPWTLRVGGYALASDTPPESMVEGATATVRRGDSLRASVTGLLGLPRAGIVTATGTNPYGEHSAVPYVTTDGPVDFGVVYAAAVVLTGAPADPELPEVEIAETGRITVRWPDGTSDHLTLPEPTC